MFFSLLTFAAVYVKTMVVQVISIVLLSLIIYDSVHAHQSPTADDECTPVAYPNEPRNPLNDNVPPWIYRSFITHLISVKLQLLQNRSSRGLIQNFF